MASILSAQPVVKSSYWWQVGDGTSIGIWTNCWIPRLSTFRVLSPPILLSADTKVSALISSETSERDVTLLDKLFLPTDVNSTLSIPLSHHKPRDRIVWAYTPKGRFIVACSLLSARDRSNIILRVPRSNHKEQSKFKENIIKQQFW